MKYLLRILALTFLFSSGIVDANEIGTQFTYQGRLLDSGSPVNGNVTLTFRLYDSSSGGAQIGSDYNAGTILVTDGSIIQPLDFGDVFEGQEVFLEIEAAIGAASPVILSPRTLLRPVPYSMVSSKSFELVPPPGSTSTNSLFLDQEGNLAYGVDSVPAVLDFVGNKVFGFNDISSIQIRQLTSVAYVLDKGAGVITAINVLDPTSMQSLGGSSGYSQPVDLRIDGILQDRGVFLDVGTNRIITVDLGDPVSVPVQDFVTPTQPAVSLDIDADNNYIYTLHDSNDSVFIHNFSNPSVLVFAGAFSINAGTYIDHAYSDGHLYTLSTSPAQISIYKFNTYDTVSHLTDIPISGGSGVPQKIKVQGTILSAINEQLVSLYDIANPGSPVLIDTLPDPRRTDIVFENDFAITTFVPIGGSGGGLDLYNLAGANPDSIIDQATQSLSNPRVIAQKDDGTLIIADNNTLSLAAYQLQSYTAAISGDLILTGTTFIDSPLAVSQDASFDGNVSIGGTYSVSGLSTMSGGAAVQSGLDVTGGIVTDSLQVSSTATFQSDVTISGQTDLNGGVTVDGDVAATGAITGSSGDFQNLLSGNTVLFEQIEQISVIEESPNIGDSIAISGNGLYSVDSATGIHAFDATTPSNPLWISNNARIPSNGLLQGAHVVGNYLYTIFSPVAGGTVENYLALYDISDPTEITFFDQFPLPQQDFGSEYDFIQQGNTLFIGARDTSKTAYMGNFFDVSTPSAPSLIETFEPTAEEPSITTRVHAWSGDALYTMNTGSNSKASFSVYDTSTLSSISHALDVDTKTSPGKVELLYLHLNSGVLYTLTARSEYFQTTIDSGYFGYEMKVQSYDVSIDPLNPILLDEVVVAQPTDYRKPYLASTGSDVYAFFNNRVYFLDATNTSALLFTKSDSYGNSEDELVLHSNNIIYTEVAGILNTYELSPSTTPSAALSSSEYNVSTDIVDFASTDGFWADFTGGRIVNGGGSATTEDIDNPRVIEEKSGVVFVGDTSLNSLIAFDQKTLQKLGEVTTDLDLPRDSLIVGDHLFILDSGTDKIVSISIADPTAPSYAGSSSGGLVTPRRFDTNGTDRLYVIDSTSGVLVYDISTPASPTLLGSTTSNVSSPQSVSYGLGYIYVGQTSGFLVFQDTGGTPSFAQSIPGPHTTLVQVDDSNEILYAVEDIQNPPTFVGSDIFVYDLSVNPAAPDLIRDSNNDAVRFRYTELSRKTNMSQPYLEILTENNQIYRFRYNRSEHTIAGDIVFEDRLGIGRFPEFYTLEVEGNALKTSGGSSWVTPSDKRLKKNIKPVRDALEKLLRLQPVQFQYNSTYERVFSKDSQEGKTHTGFVAQEYAREFPEDVQKLKASDYLLLDPSAIPPMNVRAIQQLHEENLRLKNENRSLEERIEKLEKLEERLDQIEKQVLREE